VETTLRKDMEAVKKEMSKAKGARQGDEGARGTSHTTHLASGPYRGWSQSHGAVHCRSRAAQLRLTFVPFVFLSNRTPLVS
jgi:hypothetical protein